MEVPSRQILSAVPMKGSVSLRLAFHPQGTYLAMINEYKLKKNAQYGVEIFDLTNKISVPHQ